MKRKWIALVFGGFYAAYVWIVLWHLGEKYLYKDLMIYNVVFLAVFFMLEGTFLKKFFQVFCLFCVFSCLDEAVCIGIFHILEKKKYTLIQVCILECITVIVILCVLCLIKITFSRHKGKQDIAERESIYIAILFLGLCLCGTACGLSLLCKNASQGENVIYDIFAEISYVCIIGMILFIFYIRKVSERKMRFVKTQQMLSDMQKKYYQALLDKEKETKKYRHDMNGHLICLREMVKGNIKAEEYIAELQQNLLEIKGKCYLTGNEILDILLNHYLASYKGAEVSVIGKCKYLPDIGSVDLCSIISNLINVCSLSH